MSRSSIVCQYCYVQLNEHPFEHQLTLRWISPCTIFQKLVYSFLQGEGLLLAVILLLPSMARASLDY